MGDNLNSMRDELSKGQRTTLILFAVMLIILAFQVYFQTRKITEYIDKRNEAQDPELKAVFAKEVNKRKLKLILTIVVPIVTAIIVFIMV